MFSCPHVTHIITILNSAFIIYRCTYLSSPNKRIHAVTKFVIVFNSPSISIISIHQIFIYCNYFDSILMYKNSSLHSAQATGMSLHRVHVSSSMLYCDKCVFPVPRYIVDDVSPMDGLLHMTLASLSAN